MNNYAKRNWSQYNKNLVNRGSITLWLNKDCLDHWVNKNGKQGRPAFTKEVIIAGLIIKTVYNLRFRALQSFFALILRLLQLDLKVPHYSLFCKRAKEASSELPKLSKRRPMEILIDSSGLKVREEVELGARNDSLQIIRNLGNDEEAFSIWKKLVGYHKRSLVETAFSRLKRLFGERLSNKKMVNLKAEVNFRCHVLNRMHLF
jgi:hypothetical protein